MELAIDGGRIAEAAVGAAVVLALAVICVLQYRAWHKRRNEPQLPSIAELVSFAPVILTDPLLFGGGAVAAAQRQRHDTVAYGYLSVAEEFAPADGGPPWCTLTVSLPGQVPLISVDRGATPAGLVPVLTGDSAFDSVYRVSAGTDATHVAVVLTPAARAVLQRGGLQRLMLRDSELLARTPDGTTLAPNVRTDLARVVEAFLAATPSFVTRGVLDPSGAPLPPGLYGVDGADESHSSSAIG